ncbi:hepatoma-derived growth factor-related protein 2-like [Penaeus indicus]|uniref:hepatoma-derived growth factor-related protein 2-like n=1 Tax=Penaeus indicus TaxID=29960 RepID=UPI00300C0B64
MSDSSLDDFFEEGSEDSEKYSEDCSCKSGEEDQAASKDESEPYNSASESENESPRNSWSEKTVDSVSEDAENEIDLDNEKKNKSDAEDSSKQYPDDASRSDDLEHLQMSQSNVSSSSSSSSPSKGSRVRPQSGRSPMKVLISAVQGPPSTSDEPLRGTIQLELRAPQRHIELELQQPEPRQERASMRLPAPGEEEPDTRRRSVSRRLSESPGIGSTTGEGPAALHKLQGDQQRPQQQRTNEQRVIRRFLRESAPVRRGSTEDHGPGISLTQGSLRSSHYLGIFTVKHLHTIFHAISLSGITHAV